MSGRDDDESPDSGSSDVEDVDTQKATTGTSPSAEGDETPQEEWQEGWVDLEREARRKLEH